MHVSSKPSAVRILIVDDFEPFRSALRDLLNSFASLAVVGEAIDGKSAIEMASDLVPQVIIMDVKMPCMGGLEATRAIKKALPGTYVISVSLQDDTLTQDAMTAAGSSAFIMKQCAHTLPRVIARVTGLHTGRP
jgi:DNA-binding NarL/FixJ family response regulator